MASILINSIVDISQWLKEIYDIPAFKKLCSFLCGSSKEEPEAFTS
jgi:hypothetical protein